ncbi:uncharacterized protein [Panulirus ornatus]|uniref:uncharacterized protein n=1 Tax=Panulirus ornatus TaxID=150431 RepID=UPI003A89557D
MQLSFSHATFLLAGLLGSSLASSTLRSTPTPTPTPTLPSTTNTTTNTSLHNQDDSVTTEATSTTTSLTTTKAPVDVLEEVSRLLGQMREVATSMQEAREEHERLAEALAEVTAAVRDMGEHNLHIKKKVRKMSKGLKRNSHNKKIKDGLKSLQRDHQRILHAMSLSGLNITRLHNHTRKHNVTHPHNPSRKNQHGRNRKNHEAGVEVTTAKAAAATLEAGGRENKEQLRSAEDATDNHIPDLVVDPPSGTDPPLPIDCVEVMQRDNWTSGVYLVQPRGLQPLKVWCDQTTNGGGWTVILARMERSTQEDFNKNWADYKKGFGDPAGEHWIGLEALHAMTKGRDHELRVNITDWKNSTAWAEWKEFSVAGESEKYKLKVVRYTSTSQAGDALKWHDGMKFSTPDRDNDVLLGGHCAKRNDGGWWYRGYRGCYQAHPTGRYQHNPGDPPKTSVNSRNFELGPVLVWQNWRGESYYPKTLFLMFRPALN